MDLVVRPSFQAVILDDFSAPIVATLRADVQGSKLINNLNEDKETFSSQEDITIAEHRRTLNRHIIANKKRLDTEAEPS